jgi:PAS domain S-box-containing protein
MRGKRRCPRVRRWFARSAHQKEVLCSGEADVMRGSGERRSPNGGSACAQTALARRVYLSAVIIAGASVLFWSAAEIISRPPGAPWLVLAVLTVLSGAATFRMPAFPVSFSLADTFTITAALLFGPAAGVLLVALDGLVSSWRLRISTLTASRVLFNVTSVSLAMWLAAQLFFAIVHREPFAFRSALMGRTVGPLLLFATTYFFLNTGLVAAAVAIGRDVPLVSVWREHFLPLGLTHFGGTAIAGLLLLLMAAGLANLTTLMLLLPLVVVLLIAVLTGAELLRQRSAQFARLQSYAAALRSTADAVVLTNGDGEITFMNSAAERSTGWSDVQAGGRRIEEVLRLEPAAVTASDDDCSDTIPDEHSIREYVLVRRDESRCPIEQTSAYIRDEDGAVGGVIRTFRDIRQRKAIEAERQALLRRQEEARAAADAANRAKDEFLAALSHELRTPMAAIMGWVHLLRGGRLDDERTHKALAAVERGARAQAAVVNDLLDLSRIIRGTLRLEVRRMSLPEVLRDASETVEPAVQAKHIDIRVRVDPDVATIDGDPDRLRQVFWNLLSNSVKFTPEGGSIEVVARREGGGVQVEVSDSGCGIHPEFLPYVFDRFRQADGSATRSHGGLGLGLAIVRELVELHGGKVEARSEGSGRGARFIVRLPAIVRTREKEELFSRSEVVQLTETARASALSEVGLSNPERASRVPPGVG